MKNLKRFLCAVSISTAMVFSVVPAVTIQSAQTVYAAPTKIKLNKTTVDIFTGKKITLKVKGTKAKAKWSSSDKSIATVSNKGVVKAKNPGTAVITAKINGKKLKCTVTVKEETKLSLDVSKKTILTGDNFTINATVTPDEMVSLVTWESSDTSVATVENGVVTGIKEGTATITAKVDDKSASCLVTVNQKKDFDYLSKYLQTKGELSTTSRNMLMTGSGIFNYQAASTIKYDAASDALIFSMNYTDLGSSLRDHTADITMTLKRNSDTVDVNVNDKFHFILTNDDWSSTSTITMPLASYESNSLNFTITSKNGGITDDQVQTDANNVFYFAKSGWSGLLEDNLKMTMKDLGL